MTELERFFQLVHVSFPAEPLPRKFFWAELNEQLFQPDIPGELQSRLQNRRWTEIKLMDWLMTGVEPITSRSYLEPATFLYYLPSLLVGVFDDHGYLNWAIEAILPDNRWHKPRGKWWTAFHGCVSEKQRITLCSFLSTVRSIHWETMGSDRQAAVTDAEGIWVVH